MNERLSRHGSRSPLAMLAKHGPSHDPTRGRFPSPPAGLWGVMRVLVCGGRNFEDCRCVYTALADIQREKGAAITVVIHGAARGADSLASAWARTYRVEELSFPANWQKHGKAAGPIRNQQMLDEGKPDLVIVFPGGRGTADMVRRARAAGVSVIDAPRSTPGQEE